MIDNKHFWNALTNSSSKEIDKIARNNIFIKEAEKRINMLIKAEQIDVTQLLEECAGVIVEYSSISYVQGVQDGTRLSHLLLTGNAPEHMLKMSSELDMNGHMH